MSAASCKHGFLFGYANVYNEGGHFVGQEPTRCPDCVKEEAMEETTTDIAIRTTEIVDPSTGVVYDLTKPDEAAQAVADIAALEERLQDARRAAEFALVEESQRQGTKTLRFGDREVKISGGPGATGIDPVRLRELLVDAGCPSERIEAAIKTEVTEKVDRSVARQLAGANPEYKRAVDAATYTFEKRYGVKVQ